MFLQPVTEQEIGKIISSLNINKSIADIDIPIKLLRRCINPIKAPTSICHITNMSFSNGIFPNILKTANVSPIFKIKDPTIMGNYRPISILSSFRKIIEKIMKERLSKFLDFNNILYNHQYGFRKVFSTKLAIIEITEQIRNALHKGELAMGIYLDLSKAFDTVNHKILREKWNFME